jgi:hypothetical protein
MEAENGPIRRRINSFTIKLEPFVNGLTDEEAITVRNTIESIIQSYFFEKQPWATTVNSENSNDIGDDSTTGNNNDKTAMTTTTTAAAGSVTYVGLAQILENRQTEDNQGVQLTMNGLIYFAEGSQDIPDETELLETMERRALSPEAVVEALKADFPSLQLVTVIETARVVAGDDTNTAAAAANNKPADTTTSTTTTTNTVPTLSPTVEIKTTTTTLAPSSSPSLVVVVNPSVQEVPVTEGSSSSAIVSPVGQQQDTIIDGDDSSLNIAALAGGLAAGFVVVITILGLFIIRTKRRSSSSSKKNDSNDGQYLVNINPKDLFGSTSQDDWQLNSNSPTKTPRSNSKEVEDLQKSISQQMDDLEKAISQEQQRSPSEVSKTRTRGQQLGNDASSKGIFRASTTTSYFSSLFTKVNPMQKQQQQEEVRSVSTNGGNNDGGGGNNTTSKDNNSNDGTADGENTLSDFDDAVSIQPHIVTLQALESFEEQHKMTRQVCVVQKEMLESSFERINNVGASCAGSSNLSYSSSSLDSSKGKSRGDSNNNNNPSIPQKLAFDKNRHKELEEEKEEQRIRYSMMPNPYFRRTYPGAAPGATIEDRSLPCALTPTDTTAATLARRTTSSGSETGSYTGLGMIPKLSAPAWWSSSSGKSSLDNNRSPSSKSRSSRSSGSRRKSRGSSISKDRRSSSSNKSSSAAATATAAYSDDDLAYSGDEENTFGVPSSGGWDPADAELSSIGDAPDQDEINMILFHPKVTGGNNNEQSVPQSLLNNTSNTSTTDPSIMARRKSKSPTQKQAGASEYWNGDNSVSSEESNVLKFDSSVSMEI